MMTIREYKRAESLEEAWQLNQKKNNRVIGGNIAVNPRATTKADVLALYQKAL